MTQTQKTIETVEAEAFHKAFTDISAECAEKEFRPPNSTDFGFGWRKAKEFYGAELRRLEERDESMRSGKIWTLAERLGEYADEFGSAQLQELIGYLKARLSGEVSEEDEEAS